MPIRAENRDRCECRGECGRSHQGENANRHRRCPARNGRPHPRTGSKVVLTVAHLDNTPENCGDENLRAMCQACHLNMDRHIHLANCRETVRKRYAVADLFDGPEARS